MVQEPHALCVLQRSGEDGEIEVAVLIEIADIADRAEGVVAGMRLRRPRRLHAVYRTEATTKADSRSRIA